MRIEYGFIVSGKKRYAYMTRVDLYNIMTCNYDGEPTIMQNSKQPFRTCLT